VVIFRHEELFELCQFRDDGIRPQFLRCGLADDFLCD
jgi:hypothetical protein